MSVDGVFYADMRQDFGVLYSLYNSHAALPYKSVTRLCGHLFSYYKWPGVSVNDAFYVGQWQGHAVIGYSVKVDDVFYAE